ncbi:molybdopterin molybdotransferase MoeA [Heliorestis acidaminivorans]|uniref:Molybdopterin molybdenumtransferase n=2 Tax=Heliorestis acidaminivorans TaxID=553427 RepID=A0A6I0F4J1_9FIRM|nr:molybdopterin molybdotransferase MoeA [Heliorestis acidaminivorans]
MKSFFRVKTVEEARELLLQHEMTKPQREMEKVPLLSAVGRILANPVLAPLDVPTFDRSTVDGYAVRAVDTFAASEEVPLYFPLVGEVLMGEETNLTLAPGQAVAVATGAMLPREADAVVMVEYTELLTEKDLAFDNLPDNQVVQEGLQLKGLQKYVEITRGVAPSENRLRRGEDIQGDQLLLPQGHRLTSTSIGVLAAVGIHEVPVYKKPVLGLIATGDELVSPEKALSGASVRDINSYTIAALAQEAGAEVRFYGIIADDFNKLRQKVAEALEICDYICLSGGSSVGTRDLTEEVLASFPESKVLFHGLHMKPGKPTLAVTIGSVLLFGVPGQPTSAAVVFRLLLSPLLNATLSLQANKPFQWLTARIDRNMASTSGREEYFPVRLEQREGEWWAIPVFGKSGLIRPLAEAEGLARIALVKEGVQTGEWIDVFRL